MFAGLARRQWRRQVHPRGRRRRYRAAGRQAGQDVRARGLDIRFGLATASIHVLLMAPLSALAACRALPAPPRVVFTSSVASFAATSTLPAKT